MTTTSLPAAVSACDGATSPSRTWLACTRYCTAWYTRAGRAPVYPGLGRPWPPGQDEGVEVATCPYQLVDRDVLAHLGPAAERHAFGAKLGQAALQDPFLQFEVGDAIAQHPSARRARSNTVTW